VLTGGGLFLRADSRIGKNKYRKGEVNIIGGNISTRIASGVNSDDVKSNMLELIEMFNDNTGTNKFEKGSIIHFIFLYIHPYYNSNGRYARMLHEAYLEKFRIRNTIVMMNNIISYNKSDYYKAIQ